MIAVIVITTPGLSISKPHTTYRSPLTRSTLPYSTPFHSLLCASQDSILLNAGFGVYVYGMAASIEEGVAIARKVLYSGKGVETLDKLIATTQRLAKA